MILKIILYLFFLYSIIQKKTGLPTFYLFFVFFLYKHSNGCKIKLLKKKVGARLFCCIQKTLSRAVFIFCSETKIEFCIKSLFAFFYTCKCAFFFALSFIYVSMLWEKNMPLLNDTVFPCSLFFVHGFSRFTMKRVFFCLKILKLVYMLESTNFVFFV